MNSAISPGLLSASKAIVFIVIDCTSPALILVCLHKKFETI